MVEWIVSSTVLTGLVLVLRRILKGKISLRLQYALWALVLLRLLLPWSVGATQLSLENLTEMAAETTTAKAVAVLADWELPRMSYQQAYAAVEQEYAARGMDLASLPSEAREIAEYEIQAQMAGDWSLRDLCLVLWLCGVAAVAAALCVSNLRFSRMLRRTRTRLDRPDSPLPVYLSPAVETPCLFGLFHPAVYVTEEAAADQAAMRFVLAHELTHFRHGDHLWSLLRGAALALHWYNPLVWRAAILSRRDAELACDEATIRQLGEPARAAYGRTLIALSCQTRSTLLRAATTMTDSKDSLRERITLLVKRPKTTVAALTAVILLAAAAAGCAFTGGEPSVQEAPWEWAQSVESTQLTADLTDRDADRLAEILQGLRKTDFSPNTVFPVDGQRLTIHCDGALYTFTWGSTAGVVTLSLDGADWDIASPALYAFFTDLTPAQPEAQQEAEPDVTAVSAPASTPSAYVERLFSGDGTTITLYTSDGAAKSYAFDPLAGRLAVLLDSYAWTALEQTAPTSDDFRLTIRAGDGAAEMTFLSDQGAGIVSYTDGDTACSWSAASLYGGDRSIAVDIRREYDGLEVNITQLSFPLDGTAEEAAEYFVGTVFGSHLTTLTPGNSYGVDDYEVVEWEVLEVSEDGDAVRGNFICAFTPWDVNSPGLWAGNTTEGTGAYEGKLTFYREFALQRQEDGNWHCSGFGTGTIPLE